MISFLHSFRLRVVAWCKALQKYLSLFLFFLPKTKKNMLVELTKMELFQYLESVRFTKNRVKNIKHARKEPFSIFSYQQNKKSLKKLIYIYFRRIFNLKEKKIIYEIYWTTFGKFLGSY